MADLTDANLTGAVIRGAYFNRQYYYYGSGISLPQLYSTASYQSGDLSGVHFDYNNLFNANFAAQNLNGASFQYAVLTGADFTDASIQGTNFAADSSGLTGLSLAQLYSTASYQSHNLAGTIFDGNAFSGADFSNQNLNHSSFSYAQLDGANFFHANLRGANFLYAVLNDADFTGAQIQGANLSATYITGSGITLAQLYSTASYQQHDLRGANLGGNDFTGANLAYQNLHGASLQYTYLFNADLHNAVLTNAIFTEYYPNELIDTNLSGADSRGAQYLYTDSAIVTNLIQPNGHVDGLGLGPGQLLIVHNYHGDPAQNLGPIPIHVTQDFDMSSGGLLKLDLDADPWNSQIEFDNNISVKLGGTLDLEFADSTNPADEIGKTFDLFNWTGVIPDGQFSVASQYIWDLSQLYTTGDVTLMAVPEPSSLLLALIGLAGMAAFISSPARRSAK